MANKSIEEFGQNILKPYIDGCDEAYAGNIAPVETDATKASKAYSIGEQLILNRVLYDVTANIAKDDALTVGTNIAAADDIATQIKNHTVTTDAVPTKNSTNPVQSGGVFTAEANEAATRSALGAKNMIPYPYYNGDSRDTNGILFTVNPDGSITISGEATADAYFRLTYTTGDIHIPLVSGKSYILSATGKADVAILLRDDSSSNVAVARGADATYDCATSGNFDVIILVENGANYTTPITVYPMLRLATDSNSDYQPYAKTNKELTDDVSSVKSALTNNVNENGCKNLLPISIKTLHETNKDGTWSGNAYTINGVTFTVADDLTIDVNGTANGTANFYLLSNDTASKFYHFNGCILSGFTAGSNGFYVAMQRSSSPWTIYADMKTQAVTISNIPNDSSQLNLICRVDNGVSVSHKTVSPMVCLATDYALDPTYVAPSKTNRQLTEDSVTWDNLSEVGAVNYAPNKLTSASGTDYSYSVDSDGVITVVVTNTLSAAERVTINSALSLKKGTYKLSGCADNGSVDTYRLQIYTSGNTPVALDYGKNGTPYTGDVGDIFTLSSDTTGLVLALRLGSGLTAGTYKFYPMIAPVSYNGPYVPYAKTNKELTEINTTKDLTAQITNVNQKMTNPNYFLVRYGNVCSLRLYVGDSSDVTAWTEALLTIPSDCKPKSDIYIADVQGQGKIILIRAASGDINVASGSETLHAAQFFCTWIVL